MERPSQISALSSTFLRHHHAVELRQGDSLTSKRPKRLWVICALNILTASASLFVVVFLAVSSSAPADLAPDAQTIAFAVSLATFLIVASVLAFFRIRHSRWLLFLAAMPFFVVLVLLQTLLF